MPLTLSRLRDDRRTVTLTFGDETLTITYRPSGFTPETEDRLRELANDQRGGAALVALLRDLLVQWDLLDDDGKPLPIDAKTLSGLPTIFLAQIVQAVAEDIRPNLTSGGRSAAG